VRYCAVTVLGLALAGPAAAQQPAWHHAADSVFRSLDRTGSPGCALGVVQAGELGYARGYGMANLEHGVPISPETAFYIASTSKQFTAAAISLLASEGKLDLDGSIRRWIPELPAWADAITPRHLVHHTSGIRDYLSLWSLSGRTFNDAVPLEEALALIARQRATNFPPGAQHL
jgi:CubicO group peptidase (beta-lactamase class C family)